MKSFSDLEQSKKLVEILPIESADMRYHTISHYNPYPCDEIVYTVEFGKASGIDIPCWSLAALLDYLKNKNKFPEIKELSDGRFKLTTFIWSGKDCIQISIENTIVDACYELILKLHEQKLL